MTLSRDQACARLSALGHRQKDVHHIIDTVEKWRHQSGDEWAVKRLKNLKTLLIHRIGGEKAPNEGDWIAKHPDGSPKGAFKAVWDLSTTRKRIRSLNTVMAYTAMVAERPTISQWEKFSGSVENPIPAQSEEVRKDLSRLCPGVFQPVLEFRVPRAAALDDYLFSSERRAPTWDANRNRLVTVPEDRLEEWLPSMARNRTVLTAFDRFTPCFRRLVPDLTLAGDPYFTMDMCKGHPAVGRVSFIQEPGFKLRAVANPNRVLQTALLPLQRALFESLTAIEEDCTFNQDKGVEWVVSKLNQGETVHSVDLSDATNNFPLNVQLDILRAVMPEEWEPYIQLFEYCSKGPWRVWDPSQSVDREIRWKKGQPLGLGPSFASFALAHHVVAKRCILSSGGGDYRILGDDIVMVGDTAKEEYLTSLSALGCPVSADKSISSSEVGEFAGKIISRQDGILTPLKWRTVTDRSFLDAARNLRSDSPVLFSSRQRRVIKAISEVPEEFGGLGWNPDGISMEERVERNIQTIRKLESPGDQLPVSRSNQPVQRWRTGARLVSTPTDQVKSAKAEDTGLVGRIPTPRGPDPNSSDTLFNVLAMTRPHWAMVDIDDHLPSDYQASSREGDPRGPTTLVTLETKLELARLKADRMVSQTRRSVPRKRRKPGTERAR